MYSVLRKLTRKAGEDSKSETQELTSLSSQWDIPKLESESAHYLQDKLRQLLGDEMSALVSNPCSVFKILTVIMKTCRLL